jgi:hypothetical protein
MKAFGTTASTGQRRPFARLAGPGARLVEAAARRSPVARRHRLTGWQRRVAFKVVQSSSVVSQGTTVLAVAHAES